MLTAGRMLPLFVFSCIGAAARTGPLVASFSMVSDTVEYGKWKTGSDVRAVSFSVFVFAQTVGISLSSLVVGVVPEATGYVANQLQTPLTQNGILWLFSLIPAVITLLMSVAIRFWNLSGEKAAEILRELKARWPRCC